MMKEKFLEAARQIAEDEESFSCNALERAGEVAALGLYRVAMGEESRYVTVTQFSFDDERQDRRDPQDQKHLRVMALLFVAEAWKDLLPLLEARTDVL